MSDTGLISQHCANDAVHKALSIFIGDGKKHTVGDVEAGTGIASRTVSSWIANSIENRRAPKFRDIIRIAQWLGATDGPIFLSKALGPAGFGAHNLEPQASDPGMIIATLVTGAGHFAARGADNVFCHRDQGALEPVADEMIAALVPFSTRRRS